MKIFLITTTINEAVVLRLYRAIGGRRVRILAAGDEKSPHDKLKQLCTEIGNAEYIGPTEQAKISPQLDKLIPHNSIQRRNFATLEAIRQGAELIISVDDDNVAVDRDYFADFERVFTHEFNGLAAASRTKWWSAYHTVPHRGFPHDEPIDVAFAPVAGLRVGVAEGLCLGDPDVDAYTRMSQHPQSWRVGEVSRAGYVVLPTEPWTTFNSQSTAIVRELAPAFFMLPGIGRYDDIFASLIMQRIMRETAHVTHFGKPFVWQQRNQHDLIKDLKAEIFGMEHVKEFADWLNQLVNLDQCGSVLGMTRAIFTNMRSLAWMPVQTIETGLAWCDDVESIR